MHDAFGRRINYVRLSVTDRCNLRCTYCMAEDMQFMPRRDLLTFDEIERLALHLVGRGVKRIRLTGGEPLVRKGIVDLVSRLTNLREHGLDEVTLTTNGTLLPELAENLAAAGIRRINVSLDTLDPARFAELTRRAAPASPCASTRSRCAARTTANCPPCSHGAANAASILR